MELINKILPHPKRDQDRIDGKKPPQEGINDDEKNIIHEYRSRQIGQLRKKNIERLSSKNLVYNEKGYGLLDMQISYLQPFPHSQKKELRVDLQQTKGLRRVDVMSLSDPYAKVYLLDKTQEEFERAGFKEKDGRTKIIISKYKSRTRTINNELSPNFTGESFAFSNIPAEKIDDYKVVVSIWDRNDFFSNKFLCGVRIPLKFFGFGTNLNNPDDTYFFTVRLQKSYADGHPLELKADQLIKPEPNLPILPEPGQPAPATKFEQQGTSTQDSISTWTAKSYSSEEKDSGDEFANTSSRSNWVRVVNQDVTGEFNTKYAQRGFEHPDDIIVANEKHDTDLTNRHIIQGTQFTSSPRKHNKKSPTKDKRHAPLHPPITASVPILIENTPVKSGLAPILIDDHHMHSTSIQDDFNKNRSNSYLRSVESSRGKNRQENVYVDEPRAASYDEVDNLEEAMRHQDYYISENGKKKNKVRNHLRDSNTGAKIYNDEDEQNYEEMEIQYHGNESII